MITRSKCCIHHNVVRAIQHEPRWVREGLIQASSSFETFWPAWKQKILGDRRITYYCWRRILPRMVVFYTRDFSFVESRVVFTIVGVKYATTREVMSPMAERFTVQPSPLEGLLTKGQEPMGVSNR